MEPDYNTYRCTLKSGQSHIQTKVFEGCNRNDINLLIMHYSNIEYLIQNNYPLPKGYEDMELEAEGISIQTFDPFDKDWHNLNGDYNVLVERI
jgi:hypothetical protein